MRIASFLLRAVDGGCVEIVFCEPGASERARVRFNFINRFGKKGNGWWFFVFVFIGGGL